MTPEGAVLAKRSLLSQSTVFSALSPVVRDALADSGELVDFPPNCTIIQHGEIGRDLFIVESGQLEVSLPQDGDRIPLAVLSSLDVFGEGALISRQKGVRAADVRTVTQSRLLRMGEARLAEVASRHPEISERLGTMFEARCVENLLRTASPFRKLPGPLLKALVASIGKQTFGPGEVLMTSGEQGDSAYIVLTGRVQISAHERIINEDLGPGTLLGEVALLTEGGSRRNATVTAMEATTVLVLRREDLQRVLQADQESRRRVRQLAFGRAIPRKMEGVELHTRNTTDGDPVHVLRDDRPQYHRLSEHGKFIWDRIDGEKRVSDLIHAQLQELGVFAPDRVIQTLEGLSAAGFVVMPEVQEASTDAGRLWSQVRSLLMWRRPLFHADAVVSRWYTRLGFLFVHPVAVVIGVCIGLWGLLMTASGFVLGSLSSSSLWGVYFLGLGTLCLHEVGHAFAVKRFGRRVGAAGLAWIGIGPAAFVDTSDMWLEGRGPRTAVNFAGIFVDFVTAGLFAMLASNLDGSISALFAAGALWCYVAILLNLNPVLELDGYYVLADLWQRPHLRRDALQWIWAILSRVPGAGSGRVEFGYVLVSCTYLVTVLTLSVFVGRPWIEHWAVRTLGWGDTEALLLGWTAVVVFSAGLLSGLLGDAVEVRRQLRGT